MAKPLGIINALLIDREASTPVRVTSAVDLLGNVLHSASFYAGDAVRRTTQPDNPANRGAKPDSVSTSSTNEVPGLPERRPHLVG